MFNQANLIVAGIYGLIALILVLWESRSSAFPVPRSRSQRWPSNIGVSIINRVLLQVTTTAYLTNFAYIAWKNHWGLLNQWDLDPVLSFVISFLLLDLAGYFLHWLFHRFGFLWRIHRLHHTDTAVDISTSVRFHPLEAFLSLAYDLGTVYLLGPSFIAFFINDILVFITALFNHSNISLHSRPDRIIRWITPTPTFHHIHHSWDRVEADSNFAIILTCWDRLFGTFREHPRSPYDRLRMGVEGFDSPEDLKLPRMLALPFLGKKQ